MDKKIINTTELEERSYLEFIKEKIDNSIFTIDKTLEKQFEEMMEQKKYLSESKADMDHVEKVSVRQSIEQMAVLGEHSVAKKKRLEKIKKAPYFGRIDFLLDKKEEKIQIYIGIYSFTNSQNDENLIYDWRAPICSMFYDFETGEAFYDAPDGKINGIIDLKRQYRIRNGIMEYMLESSINIHDDVLQKELSKTSNEKMRNIVATIQRDQNAIIRNEKSPTLIIQGTAGSGKTSIALHRIAFLLYKFRDSITSKDILIISPNKVFGDYISNVLPELGEESIQETSMENLADEIFRYQYKFQSFFEQVAYLLEKNDKNYAERINFKSSTEFLKKLDEYINYLQQNFITPEDIKERWFFIPAWFIKERFLLYQRMPIEKRITNVVNDIANNVKIQFKYIVKSSDRNNMRRLINKMTKTSNVKMLYKDFFTRLDRPEMFKQIKGSVLEYADVFPLIYLKIRIEGAIQYNQVKHLVIDEMQDYTPVQYKVISRLFNCKKTILGDSNQSVNPYSSSNAESISSIFPSADCMYMNKSYRSTIEITEFAQRIHKNENLEPIERHGESPTIGGFLDENDELLEIKNQISSFKKSNLNAMGIICKTQQQSNELYNKLKEYEKDIFLLDPSSTTFSHGVIVTTAHMSKGLEFDQVIVPFCTSKNYSNVIDKQMLYVACTRAMHKLSITFTGSNSKFLSPFLF